MRLAYENGKPIVEVLVYGSKGSVRYKGFLDTGASWSSVKPEDVEKLGLEEVGVMPIYTAAGNLVVKLYVAKVAFYGKEFEASVLPLPIPVEHGFDCLVGMNVIKYFRVTFDNKQQVLEIK